MNFLPFSVNFLHQNSNKKNHGNASKRIEMLVFCVNMYFQIKSTSLGCVHTNIDYYMIIGSILNILRVVLKMIIS